MTLVVDGISKRFGETVAVDGVGFEVPRGAIFGLLGANGAGKTTTVRVVLDIVRPDAGSVSWSGASVAGLPRRVFGYLPEERGLYPDMKVGEQLRFFARIRGLSRRDAGKGVETWLGRLGISRHAVRRLHELSKGNQQKVQFLAAVLHEPEVLVLDEPFSGLDPVNNELLKEEILGLKERGTTILLSTHDMERAEELCEGVALVHASRLAFAGPLHALRRRHEDRTTLRLGYSGDKNHLLQKFPGVEVVSEGEESLELSPGGVEPEEILKEAVGSGKVRRFETVEPSLREIFIREVGGA
ncbi:MAG: ATP-binding cassette domain-containing protein [Actinomycetota bacterium]|nr:ATP-binding cassette domain-containing protein [Actinomycetota bacterium]